MSHAGNSLVGAGAQPVSQPTAAEPMSSVASLWAFDERKARFFAFPSRDSRNRARSVDRRRTHPRLPSSGRAPTQVRWMLARSGASTRRKMRFALRERRLRLAPFQNTPDGPPASFPIRNLAEQACEAYIVWIELRPNDLASPRPARRTDDLLPKLETRAQPAPRRGSAYTHT